MRAGEWLTANKNEAQASAENCCRLGKNANVGVKILSVDQK